MKIAFESQLFLKGNKTGIGWCADNLIKTLIEISDYDFQLNYFSKGYSEEKLNIMQEYQDLGIKTKPCNWFHDVCYKLIWSFVHIPYSWFFGSDADITQFFNYVIPPGVKGKKVTIVHDMAYKACPETVRAKTRKWLNLTLKGSCKRADVIITVSEFSKCEIIKYLGIAEEKIVVMPNGVNLELFHPNYPENQIKAVREKYHLSDNYFLYLGTIEPRKNIQGIIDAYVKLKERYSDVPQLVLAGGKGWLCDSVYDNAERLDMKDSIIFTGYVDMKDAPLLISGARSFLFPSYYEGFGMPVLEAMACGTPVITSNSSSIPEVAGEAGLLVNPYSVDEISMAMEKLLEDQELVDMLKQSGLERVKGYTWKHSALIVKRIYDDLME